MARAVHSYGVADQAFAGECLRFAHQMRIEPSGLTRGIRRLARVLPDAHDVSASATIIALFLSTIRQVLDEIYVAPHSPAMRRVVDPRVTEALRLISGADHDVWLTVDALARLLHVSSSYLSHLIKRDTGRPLREHVRLEKMNRARRLLASPAIPVKTVAFDLGYTRVECFDRDFRRVHGCRPSACRVQPDAS